MMVERPELNEDFRDLLHAFIAEGVDFVVVGAHALAAHGVVRATGDLDLFVRPSIDNAQRIVDALKAFGAPLGSHGVSQEDFSREGTVYQLGLPPRRIDVLTSISGVGFDEAIANAISVAVGDLGFRVPGRAALLANKRASARPKDLEDAARLEQLKPERSS